jgi:hypothetical protein
MDLSAVVSAEHKSLNTRDPEIERPSFDLRRREVADPSRGQHTGLVGVHAIDVDAEDPESFGDAHEQLEISSSGGSKQFLNRHRKQLGKMLQRVVRLI